MLLVLPQHPTNTYLPSEVLSRTLARCGDDAGGCRHFEGGWVDGEARPHGQGHCIVRRLLRLHSPREVKRVVKEGTSGGHWALKTGGQYLESYLLD